MERFFAYCLDFFGCLLGWAYFAPGASRVSARQPSYFFSAKPKKFVFGCWWGWVYFASVASRVSARQPSYFFSAKPKKVTKKKASHVRAASRSLPLLAAFGALANSLRSDNASALIRTLLRCSARPNGGGYLTARPLRELRPRGLFASLTSRGLGCLIYHASLLTRARHAVPLHPHSSFLTPHSSLLTPPHASLLIMGNHKGCPYDLTPHSCVLTPH